MALDPNTDPRKQPATKESLADLEGVEVAGFFDDLEAAGKELGGIISDAGEGIKDVLPTEKQVTDAVNSLGSEVRDVLNEIPELKDVDPTTKTGALKIAQALAGLKGGQIDGAPGPTTYGAIGAATGLPINQVRSLIQSGQVGQLIEKMSPNADLLGEAHNLLKQGEDWIQRQLD